MTAEALRGVDSHYSATIDEIVEARFFLDQIEGGGAGTQISGQTLFANYASTPPPSAAEAAQYNSTMMNFRFVQQAADLCALLDNHDSGLSVGGGVFGPYATAAEMAHQSV